MCALFLSLNIVVITISVTNQVSYYLYNIIHLYIIKNQNDIQIHINDDY